MIGIDLGTTNTLVAYWNSEISEAVIIPNVLGENITPSVVSIIKNSEYLVGQTAKLKMLSDPTSSAANFKRKMGTPYKYKLKNFKLTAVELSALLLKQVKVDAELFLKREVVDAVVSVPAYFNDIQRKETMLSAKMAGLNVNRIINEPTAAAIAYGLHEKLNEVKVLVVDLGGGTLDVSLLEIYDGVIEVHASAGNNFLGGEDFTQAIIDDFTKKNKISVDELSETSLITLYYSLNKCKEQLSVTNTQEISMELDGENYTYILHRKSFDTLIAPLLRNVRVPIEQVIRDGRINPDEIDQVVMVGGATKMPSVRKAVATLLGKVPSSTIDPTKVVALGTAIQAALHKREAALEDIVVTDICPYTLGVEVAVERENTRFESGHFLPIIERNSTIPKSRVERLFTVQDDQTKVQCKIYQGESRLAKNNIRLGTLEVEVPPAKAGEESVDVRFTYSNDGILEVLLAATSGLGERSILINSSSMAVSKDNMLQSIDKLSHLKLHPRDDYPNTHLLSRLERLYEESLGSKREYIAELVRGFEEVLDGQDHDLAKLYRNKIATKVSDLEEGGLL